jgi:type I restriction enzyme M protein
VARRAAERSAQPLRFEEKLWRAADKLRGSMDAAEYKHVVLGLIFLKYISDTFTAKRDELKNTLSDPDSPDFIPDAAFREELLESRDEYTAEGVFWVPPEARWEAIAESAGQEGIGRRIDQAMELVEKQNPTLHGVLPKDYATRPLDPRRLAELVNLVGQIPLAANSHGDKDVLGRVYEYFLGKFASAEGKGGGEFYTPESVVKLLVEMVEPYSGRVYEPCCGSGGILVQAAKFIEAHAGRRDDISVYGQESNPTTWKLARMNLAIRHIDADLGLRAADTFHDDLHPDLVADFALANPPFNVSDWGGEHLRRDARWRYGVPPVGNANFAWLQHIASKLSARGVAGVVLANGSMSSRSGGEGDIRRAMVEDDLVDCMVALPTQLFFNTGIPACLWFLARDKSSRGRPGWRDRRGEVLLINARKLGRMETRVHRVLDPDDIAKIADVYHAWRGEHDAGDYVDIPGFCHAAKLPEILEHDYVLTPGRYVGAEEDEDDGEPIEDKIRRLRKELEEAFLESNRQEELVRQRLEGLGL